MPFVQAEISKSEHLFMKKEAEKRRITLRKMNGLALRKYIRALNLQKELEEGSDYEQ